VPHQTGVAEPAPVGEVIRPEWPKAAVSGGFFAEFHFLPCPHDPFNFLDPARDSDLSEVDENYPNKRETMHEFH
jgi:hypothetical protein